MVCDKCGHELQVGDWPFCKGNAFDHIPGHTNSVIGDEIDVEVKHALCWEDGTPRRFRSRAELNRVAKEKGYINYVQHVPKPGSDKSPHTVRWI